MRYIFIFLTLWAVSNHTWAQKKPSRPILIPQPAQLTLLSGTFTLSTETPIIGDAAMIGNESQYLREYLQQYYGIRLSATLLPSPSRLPYLSLRIAQDMEKEAYRLDIQPTHIEIVGGSAAGVFYGIQTLIQWLPLPPQTTLQLPCGKVTDAPRYAWRGMHLDVSRHFFPVSFIKKYIDLLASYKMNTFHWHLTDDQGWRIEIQQYPKLTSVGAWRKGSMIGHYNAQQFDTLRYGGFYTQNEIKEVVQYAQMRHVNIVPEIEMPGHSLAAIAAYPELSCTGKPAEVGKAWGVEENVFCPTEATFTFLENVLTEVIDLFPGKYIHIGGDEVPKSAWNASPFCQELMKREKLADAHALQSYFIRRIEKFVNAKGRQIIGWDEILEGGLAPNAAVMSWRGTEGGIAAAKQGHYVVMSPGSHCYFDHYQGAPSTEPLAIGGYTTVEKTYNYEPTPEGLTPTESDFIMGAQGNVWTEYIHTPQHVEYMAVPRMLALAEAVWSPKNVRDYADFKQRLMAHFSLLDLKNVHYAQSIFEIKPRFVTSEKKQQMEVWLDAPLPDGEIRYTLDGKDPHKKSPLFPSAFAVNTPIVLKAGFFQKGKQKGKTLTLDFSHYSRSTGKPITITPAASEFYKGDGSTTLVNGLKGSTQFFGYQWLGWSGKDVSILIDCVKSDSLHSVTVGVLDRPGSWIYLPQSIEVAVSLDGKTFETVNTLSQQAIASQQPQVKIDFTSKMGRYVRVNVQHAGKIPEGNSGAGENAWLFLDEVEVR